MFPYSIFDTQDNEIRIGCSKSSERNTSNETRTPSTIPWKAQTKLFMAPPLATTSSPEASQLSGALSKPSPSSCVMYGSTIRSKEGPLLSGRMNGSNPDVGGRGYCKAPISIRATSCGRDKHVSWAEAMAIDCEQGGGASRNKCYFHEAQLGGGSEVTTGGFPIARQTQFPRGITRRQKRNIIY